MKVVRKYGGFNLSHKAILLYLKLKGFTPYWKRYEAIEKYHPNYDPEETGNLVHYGTRPDFMDKEKGYIGYFNPTISIERTDPILIQVIEGLKEEANSRFSKLEIVEIPDDIDWEIEENDGVEWVSEKHRIW